MKKKWSVEMTAAAEKQLRSDFKDGLLTSLDIKVIKRWIADIEDQGLEFTQQRQIGVIMSWKGNEKIIVRVVRVTASHDYKK